MKKISRIILVLVILMGVLLMISQVQAANNDIVITVGGNTTGNTIGNTIGNTVGNTTGNTVGNTTGNKTNNIVNKVNNTTNTLPKTGIEDSPATIIMIIGVISAIYAYKKIRDYNV